MALIGIYRRAFGCVFQFWWFYLLLAGLLTGLPILLKSGSGSTTGTSAGYVFFVFFLHRHFLLGEGVEWHKRAPGAPKRSGRGFFWVSILIGIGVAAVVLGLLLGTPQNAASKAIGADPGLLVLAVIPFYWLALSVFGTALPASAANEPFGLLLTLRRSRQTAFGVAWRLLAGPGLFTAIVLLALLSGTGAVLYLLELHTEQLVSARVPTEIASFLLATLIQLVLMIASTMGVVILCEAYRRVQPAPIP